MASFSNGLTLTEVIRHTANLTASNVTVRTIPALRTAQVSVYAEASGYVTIDGVPCPEGWSNYFLSAGAVVVKTGFTGGTAKVYISEFAAGG